MISLDAWNRDQACIEDILADIDAESAFNGQFVCDRRHTHVARIRTRKRTDIDDMVDIIGHNAPESTIPEKPTPLCVGDPPYLNTEYLPTHDGIGAQVARQAAGKKGWFYYELTNDISDPCYIAALATMWDQTRWATVCKPDIHNIQHQQYVHAVRTYNKTLPGPPYINDTMVPKYYTDAPTDFATTTEKFKQITTPLREIYHAQDKNCLVASGGCRDTRKLALLLVCARWRMYMEHKDRDAPKSNVLQHAVRSATHILHTILNRTNVT